MAEKIGNAYLEVTPKVSPNFGQDIKQQTSGIGESAGTELGSEFGGGFAGSMKSFIGAGAVAVGNILANMAQQALAAVGDLFSDMFNNFADYEQLVGGVETLFGESSDIVQEYAQNAYKSAGLSANEYMSTVTSFSASLLQGLGGDTEQAAKIADMAIQDMSDNANKMGTDMASIQNAYQGFAKQNYTMLDNLKLGYGGTRGEMERLLSDAEALSGVHYDIENLSDVYEAIHVIQTEMGITGTTMLEGSATVSGSIAQMNAAWQNFLTAVGDGGRTMDLSATVDALLESVGAMLSNAIPTIGRIAASLVLKLPDILMEALQGLPAMLQGAVTDAFGEDAGEMFAPITEAMENLLSVVDTVWPTIQETISGVAEVVMSVVEVAWPLISDIIVTASQLIQGVAETVWPIVSGIVEFAVNNIKGFIESLQPIVSWVQEVFNGIKTAMEKPIQTARDIIKNAIDAIKNFFQFKIQWPHIPLPHFSISGSANPLDWFTQGLPKIGIEWYAKGGFVDGATLIGAGENGAEMILPKQGEMLEDFAEAITDEMHGGGDTFVFNITADSETTLQSLVAQAQRARIAYGRA